MADSDDQSPTDAGASSDISPPESAVKQVTEDSVGGDDSARSSPSRSPIIKSKIDVLLKAAGDAPIMKKKKWAVDRTKRIAWVIEFIKKYIKSETGDSLFLYVNQSFSPSPDTDVGTLYECFGSDGKLVLHYCKSQAWG